MNKKLTKREREVGFCLIKGMKAKEIAEKLGVSLHTIQDHQKNMKNKLNSRTMCQLGSRLNKYLFKC